MKAHSAIAGILLISRRILLQIGKLQTAGDLDDATFTAQLNRIFREPLQPVSLTPIVRELSNRQTRLRVKDRQEDTTQGMIECGLQLDSRP